MRGFSVPRQHEPSNKIGIGVPSKQLLDFSDRLEQAFRFESISFKSPTCRFVRLARDVRRVVALALVTAGAAATVARSRGDRELQNHRD